MADAVQIKWNGDEFKRHLNATVERRLALCAEAVRGEAVRSVSVPTSTEGPSLPGDPPHADTGKLRQSIFWKMIDKSTAIVGSALKYAFWLELGTSDMAGRPFLVPALYRMRDTIARILGGKSET